MSKQQADDVLGKACVRAFVAGFATLGWHSLEASVVDEIRIAVRVLIRRASGPENGRQG